MKNKLASMDNAVKFVGQIRRTLAGSGPKPIFRVTSNRKGEWVISRFMRLDTEIPPTIFYPYPGIESFMSIGFQRKLNSLLKKNPVWLSGTSTLRFKVNDGQYAKISDVRWLVAVYRLKKLEMNNKGVIAITQFEAKGAWDGNYRYGRLATSRCAEFESARPRLL